MSALIFLAQTSNWSTAAARKVSAAQKIIFLLFWPKIFPNYPIVVVFPTPLTPAIKITLGLFSFIFSKFFSRGFNISDM